MGNQNKIFKLRTLDEDARCGRAKLLWCDLRRSLWYSIRINTPLCVNDDGWLRNTSEPEFFSRATEKMHFWRTHLVFWKWKMRVQRRILLEKSPAASRPWRFVPETEREIIILSRSRQLDLEYTHWARSVIITSGDPLLHLATPGAFALAHTPGKSKRDIFQALAHSGSIRTARFYITMKKPRRVTRRERRRSTTSHRLRRHAQGQEVHNLRERTPHFAAAVLT